jgi:hypothetical protein
MAIALCRHCGRCPVNRPKQLCWGCYYTPGVADLYPPLSKYGCRGVGHGCGGYSLPEPTDAAPGSEDKLAVMAARAKAGVSIFSPLDARWRPDGTLAVPGVVLQRGCVA